MTQEKQTKRVNWPAMVVLPNGEERRLRAKRLSGRAVMLQSEQPLPRDATCHLTLRFAVSGAGEEAVVRAVCRVNDSVLSAPYFQTWLYFIKFYEGERWLSA